MRSPLILLTMLILLAGCSKEKGATASTSAQSSTCPTLNGTYTGTSPEGETLKFTFATAVEGVTSKYAFGGGDTVGEAVLVADGSTLTGSTEGGQNASVTLSCGVNSLLIRTKYDSEPEQTLIFTDLGNGQLHAEVAGESFNIVKQ